MSESYTNIYNKLFGCDVFSPLVLIALGTNVGQIAGFRDAWLDWADEAMTDPVLVILTRTGGDREATANLRLLPGYRRDRPEQSDATYVEFVYDVPAEQEETVRCFLARSGRHPGLRERFAAVEIADAGSNVLH